MDSTRFASALGLIVVYIAQSALQPWFVGAGFGLYINCRTQLEAWDIEVAFRRMTQRRINGMATAVVLALLIVPAVLLPGKAFSQESSESDREEASAIDPGFNGYWSDDEVQPALEAVVASDALKKTREVEGWQAIDPDTPEPDIDDGTSSWWVSMIQDFVRLVSYIVELGLWIAAALLLLLIFATRKHWLPYLRDQQHAKPAAQRIMLASGEVSAEALPNDVPTEVMRLWNAGRKRKALSLLYRASVFAAVTRHGVRLPSSATEGECIRAVGQQVDRNQSEYFRRVVSVWIRCAYGFQEPDDEAILPLCREWPRHYGEAI